MRGAEFHGSIPAVTAKPAYPVYHFSLSVDVQYMIFRIVLRKLQSYDSF